LETLPASFERAAKIHGTDKGFDTTLEDMIDANVDIYKKIQGDEKFADIFRMVMFKKVLDGMTRESA